MCCPFLPGLPCTRVGLGLPLPPPVCVMLPVCDMWCVSPVESRCVFCRYEWFTDVSHTPLKSESPLFSSSGLWDRWVWVRRGEASKTMWFSCSSFFFFLSFRGGRNLQVFKVNYSPPSIAQHSTTPAPPPLVPFSRLEEDLVLFLFLPPPLLQVNECSFIRDGNLSHVPWLCD